MTAEQIIIAQVVALAMRANPEEPGCWLLGIALGRMFEAVLGGVAMLRAKRLLDAHLAELDREGSP